MSRSTWAAIGCRANQYPAQHTTLDRLQLARFSGSVLFVLAVCLLTVQARISRAGNEPRAQSTPHEPNATSPSRFGADSRVALKQLHEKLAEVATRVLAGVDLNGPEADDIPLQALHAEIAKVEVQRATLAREVAEITLKEYQEGIFPQKKKACESELEQARAAMEGADRAIPEARQRYARFRQVKTGSAGDIAREWQVETGEIVAQLERKKVRFAIEQAQSRLKVLLEYEQPRDVKNLKSNVEKVRSEELMRQATLGLEQDKLERSNNPARARNSLSADRKQILELLARAIPLEEQFSSRLEQIQKDGQPAESVRTEIAGLTRELQQIVVRAYDADTAIAMGRLKSGLRRARVRSLRNSSRTVEPSGPPQADSNGPAKTEPNPADLITANRQRLNKLQEEILGLGTQVLGSLDTASGAGVDGSMVANRTITVKSAEANFENARLTREIAEIGVVEYEEGVFKQEQAVLQGEVRLAESAARATDSIEFARGQLAKIKQASRGTAEDLSLEYLCEDKIAQAIQREPKEKLALEKARAKLENLRKYVMPRRVKELKGEVEKARSAELAKKAQWEFEKSKLRQMQATTKVPDREAHRQRLLTLLDQMLPLVDQIKTKLEGAEQDRNPAQQFRTESTAALDQLQIFVEQARLETAAAQWAAVKPKLRAAATRYLGNQK